MFTWLIYSLILFHTSGVHLHHGPSLSSDTHSCSGQRAGQRWRTHVSHLCFHLHRPAYGCDADTYTGIEVIINKIRSEIVKDAIYVGLNWMSQFRWIHEDNLAGKVVWFTQVGFMCCRVTWACTQLAFLIFSTIKTTRPITSSSSSNHLIPCRLDRQQHTRYQLDHRPSSRFLHKFQWATATQWSRCTALCLTWLGVVARGVGVGLERFTPLGCNSFILY